MHSHGKKDRQLGCCSGGFPDFPLAGWMLSLFCTQHSPLTKSRLFNFAHFGRLRVAVFEAVPGEPPAFNMGLKTGDSRCSIRIALAVPRRRLGTPPQGKYRFQPLPPFTASQPEIMVNTEHLPIAAVLYRFGEDSG
jgi:hypothetical protein